MSAYVIMDVEIFDIEQYMQFMQRVRPLIEQWNGHYLARGGEFRVYEGDQCSHSRLVAVSGC